MKLITLESNLVVEQRAERHRTRLAIENLKVINPGLETRWCDR